MAFLMISDLSHDPIPSLLVGRGSGFPNLEREEIFDDKQ